MIMHKILFVTSVYCSDAVEGACMNYSDELAAVFSVCSV